MYRKSGSNGDNSEMATGMMRVIEYKLISGRLHEYFGFELLADGETKKAN